MSAKGGRHEEEEAQGSLRAISYGGGVQSTALVVLAAQGVIDFPLAIFANVGETAEHPATLSYVREIAMPWAEDRGVEIVEVTKKRKGEVDDLRESILRPETVSVPIPVRGSEVGAPGRRSCTRDWKVRPVSAEMKRRGGGSATIAIGISTDEIGRANNRERDDGAQVVYPLLDLRLSRGDCAQLILDAGLPVPPKSACYFCPFHRPSVWAEMRRDEPNLFEMAAEVEDHILATQAVLDCHSSGRPAGREIPENEDDEPPMVWESWPPGSVQTCPSCRTRQVVDGHCRWPLHARPPLYLTRFGKPLRDAITEAQTPLFASEGPESCDSGYCWT